MINVLQVNKFYAPEIGGVERVVEDLAVGLRGRMHVDVLVCRRKGKSTDEVLEGVRIHRSASLGVFASMPVSLAFIRDLKRVCAQYDLIQFHLPFPLGDLALLLSGYRGKVVLWWHSDIVRQKALLALYRPLMHRTLSRADKIIVATQGHLDGSRFLQPYREKCAIIPFCVDEEHYRLGGAAMKALQVPKTTVEILFVGRLVYYKGCDVLLAAFAKLRNERCRLTIIGTGPLEKALQKAAHDLGIAARVRFAGQAEKDELSDCLRTCDFFVLPSIARSEAFGLVQLEAMAYGKPVVNTRLDSGVPYVSIDGETGLTVPPCDAQALAEAMETLANDAALRERLGQNARKRVEEHFRPGLMSERTAALYESLARDGAPLRRNEEGKDKTT